MVPPPRSIEPLFDDTTENAYRAFTYASQIIEDEQTSDDERKVRNVTGMLTSMHVDSSEHAKKVRTELFQ